jgi:hypothetical protein
MKWTPVSEKEPPQDEIVLVRGPSGYGARQFVALAYIDDDFRPRFEKDEPRWLDVSDDELADRGWRPEEWTDRRAVLGNDVTVERSLTEDHDARVVRLARRGGWIGVDFDGTLAFYDRWTGWNHFGTPIPMMVERVKRWLAADVEVRIMTARIGLEPDDVHQCYVTKENYTNAQMASAIQDWTEKHLGARLTVTCVKDLHMIELWDDRAVQVIANTGLTLSEEHAAEVSALEGKP